MLFAQGRDFSGQRPDETNAVCQRAGNKVVVPTVRHSVYGCVLPVHALKIPFLPNEINLIVAPNARVQSRRLRRRQEPGRSVLRLLVFQDSPLAVLGRDFGNEEIVSASF